MKLKAIKELFLRVGPKNLNLKVILAFSKLKCFKLIEPYVWWYLKSSKYRRDYENSMNSRARIYIAYDGCFDMGHNFHQTTNRGWFLATVLLQGVVHPYIKNQIVVDHKKEFPLDYYIFKLSEIFNTVSNHIKSKWYMYVIYTQIVIISNLI